MELKLSLIPIASGLQVYITRVSIATESCIVQCVCCMLVVYMCNILVYYICNHVLVIYIIYRYIFCSLRNHILNYMSINYKFHSPNSVNHDLEK